MVTIGLVYLVTGKAIGIINCVRTSLEACEITLKCQLHLNYSEKMPANRKYISSLTLKQLPFNCKKIITL